MRSGYPRCLRQQTLQSVSPQQEDDPGLEHFDLSVEVRGAGRYLLGQGIAIARGPGLEDVGDEDVLPTQPDLLQELGEEPPVPGTPWVLVRCRGHRVQDLTWAAISSSRAWRPGAGSGADSGTRRSVTGLGTVATLVGSSS
jgi:hypothetical protein